MNYQMKFRLVKLLLLMLPFWALAQDLPQPMQPARLVNDFAGLLNRMEVNKLEAMLVAYDDSTSTQITVVIVPSLQGGEIADYASKLFEQWGIGQKGKNNGLLMLLAMEEKAVRLEVGYGLEEKLTDALSRRIIEQVIIPRFREGDFAGGLYQGSRAVMQVLEGSWQADGKGRKGQGAEGSLVFVVLLLIILVIVISSRHGGGTDYTGKGRAGYQPPLFFPMGGGTRGGGFSGGGFGGGFGGFGGGFSGGGGATGRW
jgi:uncharacterized protein